MTDTNKTLKELNDIIDFLKGKVDANATFTETERTDWEKRIKDLRDNNSTEELSLKGFSELDANFAKEITKLVTKKPLWKPKKNRLRKKEMLKKP